MQKQSVFRQIVLVPVVFRQTFPIAVCFRKISVVWGHFADFAADPAVSVPVFVFPSAAADPFVQSAA